MQHSHERRDTNSSPAAERLWQRFGEMFGARFFESFGPKPGESWRDAVDELRHDQIKAALSKIRNSGSPHPPSLPEFVALAKNVRLPEPSAGAEFDVFHRLGQLAMLSFLRTNGAASEDSLRKVVAAKNEIITSARPSDRHKPSEAELREVSDVLEAAFKRLWAPMPAQQLAWHMDHYQHAARVFDSFA